MSRFIQIKDEHSKILGHRVLNSQLSLYIGIFQLIICLWALTQHVYSIVVVDKILFCDFSSNSTHPTAFTGVDAIIFDIGLFHSLWGIVGCVAQHLDGGYGRFAWSVFHSLALVVCLPCAFMSRPKPYYLWPLLIQQSAYGIGLLILSLAALPRILPTFMGNIDNAPIGAIFAYFFGTMMNFFLLIVYWHWYWHVETCYNSVRKVRNDRLIESHNRRSVSVRRPLESTSQKTLNISNGFIETTRTPIANGHKPNGGILHVGNGIEKQNGIVSNGHSRSTNTTQSVEMSKKFNIQSSHLATLLEKNDAQATMRRQSILLDELSPIESSGSSLTSSNGRHQRRRLPTVGANYSHHVSRSPFMQSQCSTLSLPISQPTNFNRHPQFIKSNYTPRNDHYEKQKVGQRASLQQQQIVEPHLRQMRRYQSNIVSTTMLPRINYPIIPPPPAPITSIKPVLYSRMNYDSMQQYENNNSNNIQSSPRSRRLYSADI